MLDVIGKCVFIDNDHIVYDNDDKEYRLKKGSIGDVIMKLDHLFVTKDGKTEMQKGVVAKFPGIPCTVTLLSGEYKIIEEKKIRGQANK